MTTYIVDAFTDEPFKGNPAGVCLVDEALDPELMLAIASELGLSETAFVQPGLSPGQFTIRYFSPKMEIPLCGHATLAASKVLFERHPETRHIQFETIQKISLPIDREGDLIVMTFPQYSTRSAEAAPALLRALGVEHILNAEYNEETNIVLLEINNSEDLQALTPDYSGLVQAHSGINGVLVTTLSQQADYDFESRYFWPWSGTNEDPVTGGTHTFLAPYWAARLNKRKMRSFQCSERTGSMELELISNNQLLIKSTARIIFRGELSL
ncbi:MAG: PhzF family phenazine biosynthesis isomerase [Saprospiraceae bacterium]|nr:PhzF family phenazine biosynthesis isomerase [Saprospiraceae bacterium]